MLKEIINHAVSGGFKLSEYQSKNLRYWHEDSPSVHRLIFSHDFLKAFFGEHETSGFGAVSWEENAKRLVLSNDRLKYLSDYMEG